MIIKKIADFRLLRLLGRSGRLGLLVLMLAAAGACSSGGGGGGGGNTVVTPAPPPPPPPPPPPDDPTFPPQTADPSTFETAEYRNAGGLALVNASTAYSRGATGQGITIAVIDTGTDAGHPDLTGQILTASFDVNDGEREAADVGDGHGTLVSGVIAASKDGSGIHGIAFESQILDIRADVPGSCLETGEDEGCTFVDSDLITAINLAVDNGAQIINMSLGGEIDQDPSLENAIRNAVAQGVLVVISAGNEATPPGPSPDDPSTTLDAMGTMPTEPAYIAGQAQSLGRVVAVGAIDLNGQISDFSNRAGADARNYYILAPGEDVVTTGPDGDNPPDGIGDYYSVSGTSFAAPYVAGALALMLDAFPNLEPEEALQILLDTATDYIDPSPDPITGEIATVGTDNVSGVGILNLDAAFTPQGASTMSFGKGQVELATALAPAGGAFGDWAQQSGIFNQMVFQDRYGRAFAIGEARLAAPQGVMTSLELRANWSMGEARSVRAGNVSLSWNKPAVQPDPSVPYEREPETFYTARYSFDGGLVEFGRGGRLPSIAPRVSLTQEPGSPSALGGNGNWARLTRDIGRFSVDAFSSDNEWQDVTGVGVSHYARSWVARAAYSTIENNRMALGGALQSRFGGEDRTRLEAYTVEALAKPIGSLTFSGGVEAAAITLPGSDARNVWTSRWSLGGSAPVAGGDLSLIVAQPRRAETGQISFDGPVGMNAEGDLIYDRLTAALVPSGRQIDYETRWQFGLTDRIHGLASFAIATSPNHIGDAEDERALWLSIGGDL